MRRYAFEAVVFHLLWIALVFVFTDGTNLSFFKWLEGFYQWDARWYGTIAQDGHGFLAQTYVFPPFYGWMLGRLTDLIYFISSTFGFVLTWPEALYLSAFAIGTASFAFANTLFVVLSEKRFSLARPRLWLIAVSNPMGYFALTPYSDSFFFALFMLIMLLVLWTSPRRETWRLPVLSRKRFWIARGSLAGLLFLAPWTRLTGFAFAAWALLKRPEVLLTLFSLGGFLTYYWIRTDNPFFFLLAQQVFQMPEGSFFDGLSTSLKIVGHLFQGDLPAAIDTYIYTLNFGILPLLCLGLSLSLSVWLAKKREFEWALIVIAMVAMSHNQAFWRSTVRYTMPFFPIFYWMLSGFLGRASETKTRDVVLKIALGLMIGSSLMIQLFYARLFRSGGWGF